MTDRRFQTKVDEDGGNLLVSIGLDMTFRELRRNQFLTSVLVDSVITQLTTQNVDSVFVK